MTMEWEYPIIDSHLNAGTSCMLPFIIKGSTAGNEVQVWGQIQGKDLIPVYTGASAIVDADGRAKVITESQFTEGLFAVNYDGDLAGDLITYTIKEYSGGIFTGNSVTAKAIVKPGYGQQASIFIKTEDVSKQDFTSKQVLDVASQLLHFPSIGAGYDLMHANAGDISGAGSGPGGSTGQGCCPCGLGGLSGFIVVNPITTANGGGINSTTGNVISSRGLPLVFATTHVANERYKSPWGMYRAMGIYRKLFDQGEAYFRHVTIFREDGSRVSYEYINGEYECAAGYNDTLEKTDTGWFEKTNIGVYYEYNAHGNLKRVLDPNRNERYYVYNDSSASQKLIEIKVNKGLRPYFYYNDFLNPYQNTRIALRDPLDLANNKYMYFAYDGEGYMTSFKGPEGCTWYYDYDRIGSMWNYKGKLTKITDPDGYHTYFGFDGSG